MGLKALGRGLGVGGRKKKKAKKAKEKGLGRAPVDCHPPLDKKRWGNQTANFPKPNIILILADDVRGILTKASFNVVC